MNTSKIRASRRDRNSLNWRDHLPVHPAADLFPLMSEAELRELGEDIKKSGLRSPIVLWSPSREAKTHPVLLDGRKLDAMQLAGLEIFRADKGGRFEVTHTTLYGDAGGPGCSPFNPLTGASLVVDPYAYVVSANIHRRHLTAEQKRDLIGKLLVADPTKSDRAIGKAVKADKNTVAKMRKQKEARGEFHHVEKRTDSKGRKQPANKTRTKPAASSPARSSEAEALARREAQARAQQDVGENSKGENARLRVIIDSLENENHRLEMQNAALKTEMEELKEELSWYGGDRSALEHHSICLRKLSKAERIDHVKKFIAGLGLSESVITDNSPQSEKDDGLGVPDCLKRSA